MKKIALFAFNGEAMCFVHVLLNALDMHSKGFDIRVIIEGAACQLIPQFSDQSSILYNLVSKVKQNNLLDGACKACCIKMGTLNEARNQHLRIIENMNGHVSMANYINDGFDIITF